MASIKLSLASVVKKCEMKQESSKATQTRYPFVEPGVKDTRAMWTIMNWKCLCGGFLFHYMEPCRWREYPLNYQSHLVCSKCMHHRCKFPNDPFSLSDQCYCSCKPPATSSNVKVPGLPNGTIDDGYTVPATRLYKEWIRSLVVVASAMEQKPLLKL